MGKITGFLEIDRQVPVDNPAGDRVKHYNEFHGKLTEPELQQQGARCMDCGVPFCHWGCPLDNKIPDWNDLVYKGEWEKAIFRLHETNNFPEFTGRVCPAPCESSCVLGINVAPVTIKEIEFNIIERAWKEGWIKPQPAAHKTGKKVAVVGSGPAGMAAAQQMARAGHDVTLFEKADRIGGLIRYGIPDFKLEKHNIDRRMKQMEAEGVIFKTNCHVGVDISAEDLKNNFDAIILTGGAMQARDLPLEGRDLDGVHFAMDFLRQQNQRNAGDTIPADQEILATGKNILVIGGGDTGSDCVGTSHRQGAKSVTQIEIMPKPPETRPESNPWPYWPFILRTSSSHEEGGKRDWSISTKKFIGHNGKLQKVLACRIELGSSDESGRRPFVKVPNSEFELDVDLAVLAMGFTGPIKEGLLDNLGVAYDQRGAVKIDENRMTSVPGIFAAGDMSRGASLVVWAIKDGREAAKGADTFLMGSSQLR
jgi:glutamate synthase (NADPH) small chain